MLTAWIQNGCGSVGVLDFGVPCRKDSSMRFEIFDVESISPRRHL